MSSTRTLGQKIAYYRKRAGYSQLDLELEIGASQGSISRIENDQVNPTKEALGKVSTALKLSSVEIADLHEFKIKELPRLLKLVNKINSNLELDGLVDIIAHTSMVNLGISGVIIFLVDKDFLYAVAVDDAPPGRKVLLNILGLTKFDLKISLNKQSENLCLKSVKYDQVLQSFSAYDFTKDVLSYGVTVVLEKISEFKSGIVMPMKFNDQIIGAILYTKSLRDDFTKELDILEALTEHIALTIMNAENFKKLKQEVGYLKNEK